MSKRPFFSVMIPTRNRPELLRVSLASILNQDFKNFEIIVSDNSDKEQQNINLHFIKALNIKNFQYVKPDSTLNMHDNWEFALTHAKGLYKGVLIDKTLLRKTALKEIYDLLSEDSDIDILNYLNGGIEYHPQKLFKYKFQGPVKKNKNHRRYFDPKEELARRFSLKSSIRNEGNHYVLGKICFGFYSDRLIGKIKSKHGRLFFPTSCDYTSCALALAYADKAIFYDKILLYSINNFQGNGYLAQTKKGHALKFLKNYDSTLTILNDLPIPRLYSSLHNFCVNDYYILNRLKVGNYTIDKKNFISLCQEDFHYFPFTSNEEYEEQWKLLVVCAKQNGLENLVTSQRGFKRRSRITNLLQRGFQFLAREISYKEKIIFFVAKFIFIIKPKWFMEID